MTAYFVSLMPLSKVSTVTVTKDEPQTFKNEKSRQQITASLTPA